MIDRDGEPWFIGYQVAKILGYADPDYAVRTHCKASETWSEDSSGQVRHVKIIPERDMYRLVMKSKKPEAERFEEWVVAKVLPSIRKTGRYEAPRQEWPKRNALATILEGIGGAR